MTPATLDLADRALNSVPAADGAQATVTSERSLLLRFARSEPTQATAVERATLELHVVRDGHVGGASTGTLDDEAIVLCARRATKAAEAAARSHGAGPYPGLPARTRAGAPARVDEGTDEETAALPPAAGGEALAAAFDAARARGVEAHGAWTCGEVKTAIRSTTGIAALDRVTDAFMKVTCIAPSGRSGFASAAAVSLAGLDPRALAEDAARKAAAPGEPVRVEPGEHRVVLGHAAAAELVSWLGWTAFDGLAHAEGRGALSDRLGTQVVSPSISVEDSPLSGGTLPRAFDAEGVAKAPLPLIEEGVAAAVAHDTRSAALAGGGARSTGHALAPGGSSWGALPTNLVVAGGDAHDEAELCAGVERGLYVTRLWYTNPVRPKESLITGVTRDGTFVIEDGELSTPAEDLRVTDSVLSVLSRVEALGAQPLLWSEGEFYGRRFAHGVVCPSLRTTVRFTA